MGSRVPFLSRHYELNLSYLVNKYLVKMCLFFEQSSKFQMVDIVTSEEEPCQSVTRSRAATNVSRDTMPSYDTDAEESSPLLGDNRENVEADKRYISRSTHCRMGYRRVMAFASIQDKNNHLHHILRNINV